MNYETQYYKGIPLNLIKRKYGNRNAKRFVINHTNQNVWIPNKHLEEDGTIKFMDWLEANDIDLRGKLVTVIGRSEIVGKPLVNMMIDKGATVISCNSKTEKCHMEHLIILSNIVISAIGKPKKFDSNWFDINTIIVDVGINRDENGELCGDVDRDDVNDILDKWCYVTPVPGGVGLLTRVTLLKNVMR